MKAERGSAGFAGGEEGMGGGLWRWRRPGCVEGAGAGCDDTGIDVERVSAPDGE
ncbi:hypothetical protein Misp01_56610 [Microtetraspora sp. NBRC 13810]|nr:hypothetical protein Misp01_56610 [Microtetraspora sp. NBRC 13810]